MKAMKASKLRVLTLPNRVPCLQSEAGLGAAAMLLACLLSALSTVGFFQAHTSDPNFSAPAGVLVRILANFSCLLIPLLRRKPLPKLQPWRGHRSLWLWALLGVLATTCYYLALPRVGCGITMFLNAGSGIFIAALAPYLLAQRTNRACWVGALGSFAGLFLLTPSGQGGSGPALGAFLAILSGLFGGLAFMMVARRRGKCSIESVMLHWGVANLIAYSGFLFFFPPTWPAGSAAWSALMLAGLAGAGSQYFTAVAYRKAPAALAACLCYLSPVLAIVCDAYLFNVKFGASALVGGAIVLFFGIGLPLANLARAPARA
jgi:drug/metabolite transporter (DMT)-like permease